MTLTEDVLVLLPAIDVLGNGGEDVGTGENGLGQCERIVTIWRNTVPVYCHVGRRTGGAPRDRNGCNPITTVDALLSVGDLVDIIDAISHLTGERGPGLLLQQITRCIISVRQPLTLSHNIRRLISIGAREFPNSIVGIVDVIPRRPHHAAPLTGLVVRVHVRIKVRSLAVDQPRARQPCHIVKRVRDVSAIWQGQFIHPLQFHVDRKGSQRCPPAR